MLALLSFNAGVEIGQLLFVLVLFALFYALSRVFTQLTIATLSYPVSYLCGAVATFWMFERLGSF